MTQFTLKLKDENHFNHFLNIPLNNLFSVEKRKNIENLKKNIVNCAQLIEQMITPLIEKSHLQKDIHIQIMLKKDSYFKNQSNDVQVYKKEKIIYFGINSLDNYQFLETDLQKTYFILNHEIGHVFFQEIESSLQSHFLKHNFYQKLPKEIKKVIHDFQEEIFADLFATIIQMKTIDFEFNYFSEQISPAMEDRKHKKIEDLLKHIIEFRENTLMNKLDKELNENWHDIIVDFKHYTNPAIAHFHQLFKHNILPSSFSNIHEILDFCGEMCDYFSHELVNKLSHFDKGFHHVSCKTNEQVILEFLQFMNQIDKSNLEEKRNERLVGVYSR